METNRNPSRLTLINAVLLAFFVGAFVSPIVYSGLRSSLFMDKGEATPLSAQEQQAALSIEKAYTNIFRKASPSVVFIKANVLVRPRFWFEMYQQVEGAGSGFIIDNEGYIVTNSHVVAGAQKIEVTFNDDTKTSAVLIGRDEASDVALIKVNPNENLVPAILGDSDRVEPGQLAFALGAPFGLSKTFTVGTISAKQRFIDNSRFSRIQTDASINPGNSGGPLLNVLGEVVGINQSIISPGREGGSVGIGFAIPINEARNIIDQLKKERRVIGRPSLGVQVAQPSRALRAELGLGNRDGIVVSLVIPGSAAEDAGLSEQDFLLSADGEPLKEPGDLIKKVQKTGVGGKIVFVLIRNGQEMTITAVVGEDTSNR
ncbi:MAG: trypsin-like peptidase domain-containing protein [Spirochaetales bacterium]|nr:trypsin-like peptidase domain-containing protein [Spirochaetales bacterium]